MKIEKLGVRAHISGRYPPLTGRTLQILHAKLGVARLVVDWHAGCFTAKLTLMKWR